MARTNLKLFRIKHKLSQEEIAAKMGCVRQTYTAVEQGKRCGRPAFWNDLQKAFNIPNSEMWELQQNDED